MGNSSPAFSALTGKYSFKLPQSLLDRLPMALVTLDQTFALQQWSSNWIDLINRYIPLSADRVVPGLKLFDLIPEAEATLRPFLERVLAGEVVHQKALPLDIGDYKAYWEVGFELVRENGATYLVGVITDVTDRLLSRQELEQEIARRTHELSTVLKIANGLVTLEAKAMLELILDQLKSIVDCDGVVIMTLEDEVLTVTAYRGPVPPEEMLGWQALVQDTAVGRQVISQAEPIIVPDIRADTARARAFREMLGDRLESTFGHVHCWLAVPMIVKQQIIGILGLQHRQPDYYSSHHAELALTFAHFAAIALEDDRMVQKTRYVATLEERDRLAQELHDNLAQALGFLNLKAATTRTLLANGQLEEAEANLQELRQIVGDTYTDVREEIFNLRDKDVQGLSFIEMLQQYIAKYKDHYGLDIDLILERDEALLDFPANIGHQIIRIIQEALINVRKHAGVDRAILRFKQVDHEIQINIEDAGRGFELSEIDRTHTSGFGLQIMAERAESVGGRLAFDASPGGGVKVIIQVPIISGR
jgi:signal transduction histidine kinase